MEAIVTEEYKCKWCGYVGPAYGIGTSQGVSAPFCSNCGKNDKLTEVAPQEKQTITPADVGKVEDIL